jgi:hypothetical protein
MRIPLSKVNCYLRSACRIRPTDGSIGYPNPLVPGTSTAGAPFGVGTSATFVRFPVMVQVLEAGGCGQTGLTLRGSAGGNGKNGYNLSVER